MRFRELFEAVDFSISKEISSLSYEIFNEIIESIIQEVSKKIAWKKNPSEEVLAQLLEKYIHSYGKSSRIYKFYESCVDHISAILNRYLSQKYPGYGIKFETKFVLLNYGYWSEGGYAIPGKKGKIFKIQLNINEKHMMQLMRDVIKNILINKNTENPVSKVDFEKTLSLDVIMHELEHVEQFIKSDRKSHYKPKTKIKSNVVQKFLRKIKDKIDRVDLFTDPQQVASEMGRVLYLSGDAEIDAFTTSSVMDILTSYDLSYLQDLYNQKSPDLLRIILSAETFKKINGGIEKILADHGITDNKIAKNLIKIYLKKIYKKLVVEITK